jgi:hypothetical protein
VGVATERVLEVPDLAVDVQIRAACIEAGGCVLNDNVAAGPAVTVNVEESPDTVPETAACSEYGFVPLTLLTERPGNVATPLPFVF